MSSNRSGQTVTGTKGRPRRNTKSSKSKNETKSSNSKRQALSTLQINAIDPSLLVGGSRTPAKQKQIKKSRNQQPLSPLLPEIPLILTEDGSFEVEKVPQADVSTQTEPLVLKVEDKGTQATQEEEEQHSVDHRMVNCEEPPLEYWKILAEKRRVALIDTLREIEELHQENESLRKEVKMSERHQNNALYFQFMYRLAANESL